MIVVKLCSTKTAYSAIFPEKKKISLEKVKPLLDNVSEILAETPYMVVVIYKGVKITVFTEKFLIHTKDADVAKDLGETLFQLIDEEKENPQ